MILLDFPAVLAISIKPAMDLQASVVLESRGSAADEAPHLKCLSPLKLFGQYYKDERLAGISMPSLILKVDD